jgi:Tol biopolymer transport system component
VMRAEPESATNAPVKLTRNHADDNDPDWSPSGTRLVFSSNKAIDSNVYEIWKMKPEPSGPRNRPVKLTNSHSKDAWPTWSPDGKKIAFARETASGGWSIFKKYSDGAGPAVDLGCGFDFRSNCIEPSWRPVS